MEIGYINKYGNREIHIHDGLGGYVKVIENAEDIRYTSGQVGYLMDCPASGSPTTFRLHTLEDIESAIEKVKSVKRFGYDDKKLLVDTLNTFKKHYIL